MAKTTIKATINQALPNGAYDVDAAPGDDPAAAAAAVGVLEDAVTAARAAVNTAVGVLVADGASPTQAHVTTLNTAWGTLNTAILALSYSALIASLASDATLLYDSTNVNSKNKLLAVLRAIENIANSNGSI